MSARLALIGWAGWLADIALDSHMQSKGVRVRSVRKVWWVWVGYEQSLKFCESCCGERIYIQLLVVYLGRSRKEAFRHLHHIASHPKHSDCHN